MSRPGEQSSVKKDLNCESLLSITGCLYALHALLCEIRKKRQTADAWTPRIEKIKALGNVCYDVLRHDRLWHSFMTDATLTCLLMPLMYASMLIEVSLLDECSAA